MLTYVGRVPSILPKKELSFILPGFRIIMGKVSDIFGSKFSLTGGVAWFTVFSGACGG